MGSSLNKDQNVQIYMTLNNRVFYPGDSVEGTVHINCLKQRPYRYLNILIQGSQQVLWTQHHGKSSTTYSNFKDTYLMQIGLAKFDLGIKPGHYNFPFSILLPRAFPASMQLSGANYIKYQISAHIPPYDENSQAQLFRRTLHLRQPPRGNLPSLNGQQICDSQCCGCCCQCGSLALSMSADVSFLQYGKKFNLKGSLDNSNGKIAISNYKVVLRQAIKKVSNWEYVRDEYDDFILFDAKKPVPKGYQQNFQCEVKIPPEFTGYTAIGSIIYRTYYLALVAEASCCISNPTLAIHTIVTTSLQPDFEQKEEKQPPPGWNPITAVPLVFINVKPYIYVPSRMIDVRNQEGEVMHGQMSVGLPGTQMGTINRMN